MYPSDDRKSDDQATTKSHVDSQWSSGTRNNDSTSEVPKRIDRYEIEEIIGSGGFGNVYKAFDPIIRREVAIKVPRKQSEWSPDEEDAFLDEARKASLLRHSHVLTIYDAGKCLHNGVFIVMEYVAGETLAQRLSRHSMDIPTSVRIIREAASAIHEAHQRGLIHRDLKPSNILLNRKGESRIADFGLSLPEEKQLSERNVVSGTPLYMSPEQLRGQSHLLDGRSDIWSLGVIFYQCLTGRRPFSGATIDDLREEIFCRSPKPPRQIHDQIPRRLEDICLKCLEKSVSDRYTTALDLAEDLAKWQADPVSSSNGSANDLQPAVSSEQLADSLRQETRRWTIRASVSLLIAILVAAVGWQSLHSNAASESSRSQSQAEPAQHAMKLIDPGTRSSGEPVDETRKQQIQVITSPANARIVAFPVSAPYGFLDGAGRIETASRSPASLDLLPGTYLVVAVLDDGRFHEVYRTVPSNPHEMAASACNHIFWRTRRDGSVEWPEIEIPPLNISDEMGQFEGSTSFQLGKADDSTIPEHHRSIPAFCLDTHEMTWGEFLRQNNNQPATSLLHLADKLPDPALPVAGIWYHDAVSFAERIGKRLPSESEYEFAATLGGTRRFPWGNDVDTIQSWPLGAAGTPAFDRVDVNCPVFGLYSNVGEWTSSWAAAYPPLMDYVPGLPDRPADTWIVRGAPASVILGSGPFNSVPSELDPRSRVGQHEMALQPGLGFRCARSARPRLEASDLERYVKN